MRTPLLLLPLCLLLLAGCSLQRWFEGKPTRQPLNASSEELDIDEDAVAEEIAALAAAKLLGSDADAETSYDEALHALTERGSAIESHLIEALGGSDDWGVRWGVLNVLDSLGTRRSVEPIIERLLDAEPAVALKAIYTLRGITGHQIAPESEGSDAPVPPLPADGEASAADLDRRWNRWHATNGEALYDAWKQWWASEGERLEIQ